MCPLAFAGGPTVTLDSAHNCSSPQTLLLRGFSFGGGPFVRLWFASQLWVQSFEEGGRVGSSLAERSFMVARDIPL